MLSKKERRPLNDCHTFLKYLSLFLNFSILGILMEIVIIIVLTVESHTQAIYFIIPCVQLYCWWTILSFYSEELERRKVDPSRVMDISI